MKCAGRWLIAVGLTVLVGVIFRVGTERTVAAQARKTVTMTRLYTGPDGQTQAEDVEVKFTAGNPSDVAKITGTAGAELHRRPPGSDNSFHNPPRRQYVITLSGLGEVELADGKKITLNPGHMELAEDMTGKGHITRVLGTEDWITLQLPLVDQPGH